MNNAVALVDFRSDFPPGLADLDAFVKEGLVDISAEWITLTPRGRLLVRPICMVFDRYLSDARRGATYSKVI